MKARKPIYVARPTLPPLEALLPHLETIWDSRILTNMGEFHQQLEQQIEAYLDAGPVTLTSSGTVALVMALKALEITGEVITTPFSFAATAHAIDWVGCTPVFVDIEANGFNLNPACIERAITDKTRAILAVHCFGVPCNTVEIQRIADKHGLKVIYDAAHAFGVRSSPNVIRHGDCTVFSFHATKLFSTIEGGAVVCHSAATNDCLALLRNFGIVDESTIACAGTNAKLNEICAAIGVLQLAALDQNMARMKAVHMAYQTHLKGVPGLTTLTYPEGVEPNYSYFPILLGPDFRCARDTLHHELKRQNIHSRRYFSPLLSEASPYCDRPACTPFGMPNARRVADNVICLPMYPDLSMEDIVDICSIIKDN
ncbi:DegT/DnrJ/EryC1/StrS family aminotransferase [Leeia oryzae]|uniref:DegT/DnrJ/EryC1/StrS family aminotransferase n=1 Tax=Leeia oryzae TaxID=356662 RepID=UPI0003809DA5|nr:DegT/DnrJ/EryC1/StrS family aminotransferase [Leeia oryzae]